MNDFGFGTRLLAHLKAVFLCSLEILVFLNLCRLLISS